MIKWAGVEINESDPLMCLDVRQSRANEERGKNWENKSVPFSASFVRVLYKLKQRVPR